MSSGSNVCPNCGHSERTAPFLDRPDPAQMEPDSEDEPISPLSPSTLSNAGEYKLTSADLDEEIELPLEEAVRGTPDRVSRQSDDRPEERKAKLRGKSGGKKKKTKSAAAVDSNESVIAGSKKQPSDSTRPVRRKESGSRAGGEVSPTRDRPGQQIRPEALIDVEPSLLRQLVLDDPEVLEPGLSALTDDSGTEVGRHFETEVGEIDLLARDASGGLVVVVVAPPETGRDLVPELLHRIGWVRKHLVKSVGESVRCIVLVEGLDEQIGYAAAAVADTIEFHTWRASLAIERLVV